MCNPVTFITLDKIKYSQVLIGTGNKGRAGRKGKGREACCVTGSMDCTGREGCGRGIGCDGMRWCCILRHGGQVDIRLTIFRAEKSHCAFNGLAETENEYVHQSTCCIRYFNHSF